jgi:hypothetical protein
MQSSHFWLLMSKAPLWESEQGRHHRRFLGSDGSAKLADFTLQVSHMVGMVRLSLGSSAGRGRTGRTTENTARGVKEEVAPMG